MGPLHKRGRNFVQYTRSRSNHGSGRRKGTRTATGVRRRADSLPLCG